MLRHAALTRRSTREGADAAVSVSAAGFWFYKGTAPMRLLPTAVPSPPGPGILRPGFRTRVAVFANGDWSYLTWDRGPRLIFSPLPDEDAALAPRSVEDELG